MSYLCVLNLQQMINTTPKSDKFVSSCAKLYNIFRVGSTTPCQPAKYDVVVYFSMFSGS